jgi:dimethylargininase
MSDFELDDRARIEVKLSGSEGKMKQGSVPAAWVGNEGDRLRRVIVCAPRREYFRVDDLDAHNIEAVADRATARKQHTELRATLRKSGARVINLLELPGHPNSVFARDACLVTPAGYVKLRMGLPTRRGEEDWLAGAADGLGIPRAGSIEAPGTVEGGDVILAGRVAFVGLSARTNESGVRQLARLLSKMDFEVRSLRLPASRFHIGGEMSLAGPKTVLCYGGFFPSRFFDGFEMIEIPDSGTASPNMIALGKRAAIVEKKNSIAAKALRAAGFFVHSLDLSEFVKGRGGPSCLIMPVSRSG